MEEKKTPWGLKNYPVSITAANYHTFSRHVVKSIIDKISRHSHRSVGVVLPTRCRGLCAPFVNYSTDAEGDGNVLIMPCHERMYTYIYIYLAPTWRTCASRIKWGPHTYVKTNPNQASEREQIRMNNLLECVKGVVPAVPFTLVESNYSFVFDRLLSLDPT